MTPEHAARHVARHSVGAPGVILPSRYDRGWYDVFMDAVKPYVADAADVLDAGSGRRPAIPMAARPAGLRYVGLDLSAAELRRSEPGSYDEVVESDLTDRVARLDDSFDVVVSYQVLEHIQNVPLALENVRRYLRSGGTLVALFSGKWSAFGALNMLLPSNFAQTVLPRITPSRASDSIFPAYYDHCTASKLRQAMSRWETVDVQPLYRGAGYFQFSRVIQRVYLQAEDRIARSGRANLATHYVLIAKS